MTLIAANRPNLVWRPYERKAAEKYFGTVIDIPLERAASVQGDVVRWFPESENINKQTYEATKHQYEQLAHLKQINSFGSFMYVHDKNAAFDVWRQNNVSIPKNFQFSNEVEFHTRLSATQMDFPYLIRLNNSVAGWHSWLINNSDELHAALPALMQAQQTEKDRGINTTMLCSEFIDTRDPDYDFNVSYRVTVAGDHIVTGYARVSPSEDWVAITNKFNKETMDAWYFHNIRLHEIMREQEDEIVRAVKLLGLNHQGVDIIPRGGTKDLVFLEVQTTYDAGFATPDNKTGLGPYVPPYFNPYNPTLLQFIRENQSEMDEKIPLYTYNWLNKERHFDQCYKNLKEIL